MRCPRNPLAIILCFALLMMAWSGCAEERYGVSTIQLRYATPIERRASLSILRRAWRERPSEVSPEGNLYERSLLNRASFFGRKVNGTETYEAACDFWMACVRDHIARYEEDAHRFHR